MLSGFFRPSIFVALLVSSFWTFNTAHATCTSAPNGTVQTLAGLLAEFQDGQAPGSIVPGCMRDLIATLGPGNVGIEIDFYLYGVPASSAILAKVFSRSTTVPAAAAIKCNAIVGATSSYTVTLKHLVSGSPTSVGTLVFAASGSANQNCTATFTSAVTFAVGDLLEATFPTADTTISGVSISIPALQ